MGQRSDNGSNMNNGGMSSGSTSNRSMGNGNMNNGNMGATNSGSGMGSGTSPRTLNDRSGMQPTQSSENPNNCSASMPGCTPSAGGSSKTPAANMPR
jgi:hypothetical protein